MTQFDFNLNLALSLYESPEEFPVDFDDAWPWLDFSTKGNAKRNFEKCGFIDGTDFYSFIRTNKRAVGATQVEVIKMTVECFKMWAMMVGTDKGKEVRLYFLECEKIAHNKLPTAITLDTNAVPQVKQFSDLMDIIFSNVNIDTSLIAAKKLNYAQKLIPSLAPDLEEQRSLLINSTATDDELLTPTQLGQLLTPTLSARKVNECLIQKGYQIKNPKKKSQRDMAYTVHTTCRKL